MAALIGDVADSSSHPNRAALQANLVKVLASVNRDHDAVLVSRLDVTAGDEFEAIFRSRSAAFRTAVDVSQRLVPLQVRFGIGVGRVATPIEPSRPGHADGPCFHAARRALETARKNAGWIVLEDANLVFSLVNDALALAGSLRRQWTRRQAQIVREFQELGSVTKTAKRLRVAPPTVSRALSRARHAAIRRVVDDVQALLDEEQGQRRTPTKKAPTKRPPKPKRETR